MKVNREFMCNTKMILEDIFLEQYIFCGLKNLNNGFDVPSIYYFSESDFVTILKRINDQGLGILAIEVFRDGEFYDLITHQDYFLSPSDSNWYMTAFEDFQLTGEDLQYSASFCVPGHLLLENR